MSPSGQRHCSPRLGPLGSPVRAGLRALLGVEVGVIISDTFGRPWRRGVTTWPSVAPAWQPCGSARHTGRERKELVATEVCVADELASAAELVMGKDRAFRPLLCEASPMNGPSKLGPGRNRATACRGPLPITRSREAVAYGNCWRTKSRTARVPSASFVKDASRAEWTPAQCQDSTARAHRDEEEP